MSLFSRIAGAVASFFQFGGPGGAGINNNGGALEAKNSTNSAFAILRAADPVGANDVVTLEYLQNQPLVAGLAYANFQNHKVIFFNGSGVTSAPGAASGFGTISVAGTETLPNPAGTTKLAATRRLRTSVSSGNTSQLGVWEGSTAFYMWRGNAPGVGGFKCVLRFALTSLISGATIFFHVGAGNFAGSPGFVDYTVDATVSRVMAVQSFTATAAGGVPAGTNWLISACNGAANNLTNTGMPVNLNDYMELILYCAGAGANITWTLNDLTLGTTASGTVTVDEPAAATLMVPAIHAASDTAGTSGTTQWEVSNLYVELFDG
jgi:hypothetical protein